MTFTPEVWQAVLSRVKGEVPDFAYRAWLIPLCPKDGGSDGPTLICPSRFHSERVRKDFLPRIQAFLCAELGQSVELKLGVETDWAERRASRKRDTESSRPARSVVGIRPKPTRPIQPSPVPIQRSASRAAPPDTSLSKSTHTFDSFVVGPCNSLAREVAWALAHDGQRGLSQLYLRAEPGMGKTHLARAVASESQKNGADAAIYVSAENFTNQFLSSLRNKRTHEFMRRYRTGRRLLVLEDIQFLEGKSATQHEFFHTVQHILDTGGKLMLTGDKMPGQMHQFSRRLRSQLSSGFVAELEPPDAQVRRAILRSKAAHGGVRLPSDCLDLLVESIRGSVRDLEGILVQLVTSASLLKQPITLELTRKVIQQRSGDETRNRALSIADVISTVALFFGLSPDRLSSRSRKHVVLLPRQISMYLCHKYTESGINEIGQALGREQPAVRNAIAKIERGMLERPPLRYQIEGLGQRLDDLASLREN